MNSIVLVAPDDLREMIAEAVSEAFDRQRPAVPEPSPISCDLLTTKEACAALRLSRSGLMNFRRRGQITPVVVGRRTLYRRRDVAELISR